MTVSVVTPRDSTTGKVTKFRYKARVPSTGKTVKGTVRATHRSDVVLELNRLGLVPLEVDAGGFSVALNSEISMRRTPKKRELVTATRQFASMLEAGLPYIDAIELVRKNATDPILVSALQEVRTSVQGGSSLASALRDQGDVFPPLMINLIEAGETGGQVKEAMKRIADQMEAEDILRAKVKKAMVYPVTVFAVTMLVFALMLIFVVPKFTAAINEMGGPGTQLPWLTRQVIAVSDASFFVVPIVAVVSIPLWLWYKANRNKLKVRQVVDPIKLKLPVFGKLTHKTALARFTRNLGMLLSAGVPILDSLEITARTVGNIKLEAAILAARGAKAQGHSLVEPLKKEPLFEPTVIQMVEVGEASGTTAQMLHRTADIYERDVDAQVDALASTLGPLMMVPLTIIVGIVVIAMYLPYFTIGEVLDQGSTMK